MEENRWKIVSLILIGVIVGYSGSQIKDFYLKPATPAVQTDIKGTTPTQGAPSDDPFGPKINVSAANGAVLGDKNAKVTMIEFSDFQCPYCAKFFNETYAKIKSTYIDTGKVKLIFRHYPLSFHPQAEKASQTAACAGEQGKFFEMHDILFQTQSKWSEPKNPSIINAVAKFKTYAANLKLDTKKFNECLDSGKTAGTIKTDLSDGNVASQSPNGLGTPTFFVNGTKVPGAQEFSTFQYVIERELAAVK